MCAKLMGSQILAIIAISIIIYVISCSPSHQVHSARQGKVQEKSFFGISAHNTRAFFNSAEASNAEFIEAGGKRLIDYKANGSTYIQTDPGQIHFMEFTCVAGSIVLSNKVYQCKNQKVYSFTDDNIEVSSNTGGQIDNVLLAEISSITTTARNTREFSEKSIRSKADFKSENGKRLLVYQAAGQTRARQSSLGQYLLEFNCVSGMINFLGKDHNCTGQKVYGFTDTVTIKSNTGGQIDSVKLFDVKLVGPKEPEEPKEPEQTEVVMPPTNPGAEGKITLPFEVLGPAGTSKTLTFNLSNTDGISHLLLQCNSCGYRNRELDSNPNMVKASVSINDGTPIPLKAYTGGDNLVGNREIEFLGPEASYGGIGGGMRTVTFTVPITGLVNGENRVTFRHKDAAAPSIGYRISKFNLISNGDQNQKVLGQEFFVDDDPRAWTSPLSSQADIQAGEALWHKRNHLYDSGLDLFDGIGNQGGPVSGNMKASCADCHAKDGRDLAYFNFSNESIIKRSQFHLLSERQGQQIAAYIRNIDLPVVLPQARPWNPPYQPGPGLDSKPAYEWAAGAGLDAVLKDDAETKDYLFPNGTSAASVKAVVDRFSTLNMRELPVALQMPDWNSWLPLVHPSDAFDESHYVISTNDKGDNIGKPYYLYLYERALNDPSPGNLGDMVSIVRSWIGRGSTCYTQNVEVGGLRWRAANSFVGDALTLGNKFIPSSDSLSQCGSKRRNIELARAFETAKRGLHSWLNVKQWEIIHGQNLETQSANLPNDVCAGGTCIDASEARGWYIVGQKDTRAHTPYAFFSRAPHYIGYNATNFTDQDQIVGRYESNVWYHFQLIMDPGYRRSATSHFAYTIGHVEKLNNESEVSQSYRFWASLIKIRQLQTNGRYGKENGLDLRTAQPFRYYADRRGRTGGREGVGNALWANLLGAFLEDLVEDASNATQAEWDAANQNRAVQDSDSRDFGPYADTSRPFKDEKLQGKNTAQLIPSLRDIGVSESAISALLDWCEDMWPLGPWNQLRN